MASEFAPAWELELETILEGIDKDECEDNRGWWETREGARFGAEKLADLKAFIYRLLESGQ